VTVWLQSIYNKTARHPCKKNTSFKRQVLCVFYKYECRRKDFSSFSDDTHTHWDWPGSWEHSL